MAGKSEAQVKHGEAVFERFSKIEESRLVDEIIQVDNLGVLVGSHQHPLEVMVAEEEEPAGNFAGIFTVFICGRVDKSPKFIEVEPFSHS